MKTVLRIKKPSIWLLCFLLMAVWACRPHAPDPDPVHPPGSPPKPSTQMPYEVFGRHYVPVDSAEGFTERGIASWYGNPFHGRATSSGETYNMHAKTAAHPTLPMGTFLLVQNLENGREVIVRVNDRGPFAKDRVIDLSHRAARKIDMIQNGTALVQITYLDPETPDIREKLTTAHPDYFTGDFTLQVGAYSDRSRAEALRGKLQELGKDVFITSASIGGQPVYRVRVGRFSSLEAAEQVKRLLVTNGYENVFTVSADK